MVRGYKVLSFLALNEDGVPPHWHWKTDVIENLEEEVIVSVEDFGLKLIKKIDKNIVTSFNKYTASRFLRVFEYTVSSNGIYCIISLF